MTYALPRQLKIMYKNYGIVSEADLQAAVWFLISRFLRWRDHRKHFRVVNNPYCETLRDSTSKRGIHPDLMIFNCEDSEKIKAWIAIELKESKRYKAKTIEKDRERLKRCLNELGCKRAYIVFVARRGWEVAKAEMKSKDTKNLSLIPLVLDRRWEKDRILKWEPFFKSLARYKSP
jgi:hypothetical protein